MVWPELTDASWRNRAAIGALCLLLCRTAFGFMPGFAFWKVNPAIWTGATGDGKWSTAGNWRENRVPSATTTVLFDGDYCGTFCDASLDVNVSVRGLTLASNYTGTLTQGTSTLTVGASGYTQNGGTFTGSASAAQTISGAFALAGGTFTATGGTLTLSGSNVSLSGAATFNANSGKAVFSSASATLLSPGGATFNQVSFAGSGGSANVDFNAGTMTVNGPLSFDKTEYMGCGNFTNGTILAYGDVSDSGSCGGHGTAWVKLMGNASGQTITGVSTAMLPSLEIAAGANAVTLSGYVYVSGDYTMTSVGTFTSTGSTIDFARPASASVIPGSVDYNNVTFSALGNWTPVNLNAGTISVLGTLTLGKGEYNGCGQLTNGTFNVAGDVKIQNGCGGYGNTVINFVGSTDAGIYYTSPYAPPSGNVTVNKSGGATVTLHNNLPLNSTGQSLTLQAGAIDMAGYNLTIKSSLSLNGNTLTKNAGTLSVAGSIAGTGSLYGGTVDP